MAPKADCARSTAAGSRLSGARCCPSIRDRGTGSRARRASGAPFVSWTSFRAANFRYTAGAPGRYASSELAFREFCPSCGTQLTFRHHQRPDELDVTLASLDDPASIQSQDHTWTKRQITWIELADGLPRYPAERSRD